MSRKLPARSGDGELSFFDMGHAANYDALC